MSDERIRDADALILAGRWEFAYYAAGYAVECALKSCLLQRMVLTGWVFDEANTKVADCRVHDFSKLVVIAGLNDELDSRIKLGFASGDGFNQNWNDVLRWKSTSRYLAKMESDARGLYQAITEIPDGVLPWLRIYW